MLNKWSLVESQVMCRENRRFQEGQAARDFAGLWEGGYMEFGWNGMFLEGPARPWIWGEPERVQRREEVQAKNAGRSHCKCCWWQGNSICYLEEWKSKVLQGCKKQSSCQAFQSTEVLVDRRDFGCSFGINQLSVSCKVAKSSWWIMQVAILKESRTGTAM